MQSSFHYFSDLFAQLGLGDSPAEIETFVSEHSPLPADTMLEDAPFWSRSQADFLRQAKCADSDWAEVVDTLNAALRKR